MITEYRKEGQADCGAEKYPALWYARVTGEPETLTDGHPTPGEAVKALMATEADQIDNESGLSVEYFQFLEEAAPRLIMNQVMYCGHNQEVAQAVAEYANSILSEILEPIRQSNDELPWTRHSIQKATLRNACLDGAKPTTLPELTIIDDKA